MAKQRKPVELNITVTFSPVPDYRERLSRVIELLMRSPASKLLNDKANKLPLPEDRTSEEKQI